ncbi:hypothetical protein STIAU_8353 [Stigmatella aurantiaca DW4/3-1]|uniref:Uncharacterized protein n=1 Tax=Stigmatella aurantiaca (strain DW4/3-1) TaxID=378806 RepID=Q09E89_STIAD|nr:hypothetical protein STIAU_8353 [Stigmatella aurantiaca DW4/3-1]
MLGTLDDQGWIVGDAARGGTGLREQFLGGCEDLIDEAHAEGALRVHVSTSVGQLARVSLSNDARQALEGAKVRDDADLHLAQGELRLAGAVAEVTRGDEVHASANAPAMHGGDEGLAAAGNAFGGLLHVANQLEQLRALQGEVVVTGEQRPQGFHHPHQVQAVGEVVAMAAHQHHPYEVIGLQVAQGLWHLPPEVRSHGVATSRAQEDQLGDSVRLFDAQRFVSSVHDGLPRECANRTALARNTKRSVRKVRGRTMTEAARLASPESLGAQRRRVMRRPMPTSNTPRNADVVRTQETAQRRRASMTLTMDPAGVMRSSSQEALASNALYALAVRSRPPAMTSMFKSMSAVAEALPSSGMTLSTTSSRPPVGAARWIWLSRRVQLASSQSWRTFLSR